MELPELGQHCSLQECRQLDFLPFTCNNCQLIFCKEHYITSAHDCKCLNEFFKKESRAEPSQFFPCNQTDCSEKSPIQLLCSHCNLHFCVSHRHHGCTDDLMKSELKKLKVEEWRKPKEQFRKAKAEADKKVEMALRKAETTQLQPLAQKIRLMKIKGKALGENKIPATDRIYFAVQSPWVNESADYKPSPLFTSRQWTVGRTIDLFSKKLKVVNKNNEINEPKLRLFRLADGKLIAETTGIVMGTLMGTVIQDGDSLIMDYVKEENLNEETCIDEEILEKYKLAAVQ